MPWQLLDCNVLTISKVLRDQIEIIVKNHGGERRISHVTDDKILASKITNLVANCQPVCSPITPPLAPRSQN
jgi:hypothetical protein